MNGDDISVVKRDKMTQPYDFLPDLNLSDDVVKRLTQSLNRVVDGNFQDYRSPFMNSLSLEEILGKFDAVFEPLLHQLDANLVSLETNQREKIGPRSVAKPWHERRESLEEYFKDYSDIDFGPVDISKSGSMRPISVDKAVLSLKNNTSSGLPFLKKKKLIKGELVENYNYLLQREDDCVLFTRTQEQGKTRNVWGFPAADTLREMTYFLPLLEKRKRLSWRSSLLGPDYVNLSITNLFHDCYFNNKLLVSVDFSRYDSSIGPSLQKLFFNMLRQNFQDRYVDEIYSMERRVSTIGIVTPDGVWSGPHGNPSGGTFTLELNSEVQYSIASRLIPSRCMNITGDDGVYVTDDPVYLLNTFTMNGLSVNMDKSHVSNDFVIYLQNYYSRSYERSGVLVGVYPIYRALNRIIHQERWTDFEEFNLTGQDYYSIRTISILENCKYHPLYKELVKFVIDNDKYSLNYSENGISNYIRMITSSRGSSDLINNQYSDDVRGFRSFDTVKLIKELT